MGAIAIRQKLQEYIRIADDKKVKAIYTMLENEIKSEYEWWKDEGFIKELDKDVAAIKAKKQRTYSFDQVKKNALKHIKSK
jgi:hypothetical protein